MNYSQIIEFLQRFETAKVIDYLRNLDLTNLLQNPWLLGGIGLLAVVALLLRWRMLLVTLFSVSALTGLIVYTLDHEKTTGAFSVDSIVLFVTIGATIVLLTIYFLFIKTE